MAMMNCAWAQGKNFQQQAKTLNNRRELTPRGKNLQSPTLFSELKRKGCVNPQAPSMTCAETA